jgi:Zn-dependent protease with chaperone function
MIPSSPGRTWLFIGISLLLFFAPDILLPDAWRQAPGYPTLTAIYLGVLVLLGFILGPAVCQALVLREDRDGPARRRVDAALASLASTGRTPPRVVLAEHPQPFVLTVGLLPTRSRIFVSSAFVERLPEPGVRFLLARAVVHAGLAQRLVAVLPVLALTVLLPDTPHDLTDWIILAGFLAIWLVLHWTFELAADRGAARLAGQDAVIGLCAVSDIGRSPAAWATFQPPFAWRMRVVQGARDSVRDERVSPGS